jgi:hypothetical protein
MTRLILSVIPVNAVTVSAIFLTLTFASPVRSEGLEGTFRNPPQPARVQAYWF